MNTKGFRTIKFENLVREDYDTFGKEFSASDLPLNGLSCQTFYETVHGACGSRLSKELVPRLEYRPHLCCAYAPQKKNSEKRVRQCNNAGTLLELWSAKEHCKKRSFSHLGGTD